MQQRLRKYYSFESLHNILKGYNNFKNKLQDEKVESKDLHHQIESDDLRRKIPDRQIIESTIALSQYCLSKEEQEEISKLLVKYTEAFSLRDEIGTCPNI